MKWLSRYLRRDQQEDGLQRELQFHIEERLAEFRKSGLNDEEAQRRLRLEFGGLEQVKEQCRDARRLNVVDYFFRDLRYAFRSLSRNPRFAFAAVSILALGTGANAAIFSLISGVLLRPLPFSNPSQLMQLNEADQRNGVGPVASPDLDGWRRQSVSFDGMFAYGTTSQDLQSADQAERLAALRVERGLFRMLGVQAAVGRSFADDDPANVVVLSAALWQRRFGGGPVVGSQIILGGEPHTIIGVMPAEFQFPSRASQTELWILWDMPLRGRVDVVGRLKRNIDVDAARNELTMITARLAESQPASRGRIAMVTPLSEAIVGKTKAALLTLLGAVGVVLLIACVNVMNLVLVRGAGRTHELALRVALGASRSRLVMQLLTESILISAAGGAAGLLLAIVSKGLLLRLTSSRIPRLWEVGIDWRVFAFLLVVVLGSALFFGLLPALAASRLDVQRGLSVNRSVGYAASGWKGRRLRDSLIVAEIAMAFVLVVGAGLLLRAFIQLQNTPAGFVSDHVLSLNLSVPMTLIQNREAHAIYLRELEQRLHEIPGVQSAGFIQFLPLQNWGWWGFFSIQGKAQQPPGHEPQAELRFVSPGYFSALGIPLRSGRTFNTHDSVTSPMVMLINEALARRYFPGEDPVGKLTNRGTIIGVVGDVRQTGLERPAKPEIYRSFLQDSAATSEAGISLVVRTRARPETLVTAVKNTIHEMNPNQAVFNVKTMDDIVSDSLSELRLYLWLIGIFAGLALVLAIAGTYSVVSYAVTLRTQEFAIRLALGASRLQISSLVLGHSALLLAFGLAAGVAGALALTRTLKSLSSSLSSPDVATLATVCLVLGAVTLAACLVPVSKATHVDPNTALKYE